MEYDLDIPVDHLIEWLKDELAAAKRVEVRATREYVAETFDREDAGIGPDDDVEALTSVGTLEITPTRDGAPWILRVRVEDVVGPHIPEDGSADDGPEEIALETFEEEFVDHDCGTVFVTLEAESPQGKRRFDRLLCDLIVDRHKGVRRA